MDQEEEDQESGDDSAASPLWPLPDRDEPEEHNEEGASEGKKEVGERVDVDSVDVAAELLVEEAIEREEVFGRLSHALSGFEERGNLE